MHCVLRLFLVNLSSPFCKIFQPFWPTMLNPWVDTILLPSIPFSHKKLLTGLSDKTLDLANFYVNVKIVFGSMDVIAVVSVVIIDVIDRLGMHCSG